MNPERLMQNFNRLIDTPDAVPRLRRFILNLAVRGKLVEQNPDDEPAAELLKRIEAEKRRLEKLRHIKKSKEFGSLSAVEVPFDIPDIWKWTPFSKLVDFAAGRTPSRHDTSFWNTGDYHWVSIADMTDGKLITSTKETVSEKAKTTVFKNSPSPAGTIVMSFKLTIGKVSRLSIPAFHNEAIISIYPHLSELDAYLFQFLPLFSQSGTKKNALKGATLNRESLSNLLVPLPPLAEQYRIVAKVYELMKLCDELEAAQLKREKRRDRLVAATLHGLNNGDSDSEASERLPFKESARFYSNHLPRLTTRPEHIQQLRQTILNLAVRGKLVPQDPKDEPAEKLLMRIENEKKRLVKSGAIKEAKPLSQIKVAEMLFIAPAGWKWTRLSDSVNSHLGGGTPSKGNATYWNGDIFWASVKDIGKTKYVDQTMDRITQAGLENSSSNLIPPGNLIVVTRMGLGKVSINRVPMAINQDLRALFLSSLTEIDYYYIFFKTASYEGKGLTVKGIKVEELLNFPFPLPPLAEQHRIVAKMYELMTLCDELETRVTTDITTNRKFLEVTLQEALSGANYGEEAIL